MCPTNYQVLKPTKNIYQSMKNWKKDQKCRERDINRQLKTKSNYILNAWEKYFSALRS